MRLFCGALKMRETRRFRPPNSIVVLLGDKRSVIPDLAVDGWIASSGTGVTIATRYELDGPTTFTLSDESPVAPDLASVFDEIVIFEGGFASLDSVGGEILRLPLTQPKQRVRVLVNIPNDPYRIEIYLTPVA